MTDDQVQTLLMGMAEIGMGLVGVMLVAALVLWWVSHGLSAWLAVLDGDTTDARTGAPKDRRLRRVLIARAIKDERARAWRRRARRHAARVARRARQ